MGFKNISRFIGLASLVLISACETVPEQLPVNPVTTPVYTGLVGEAPTVESNPLIKSSSEAVLPMNPIKRKQKQMAQALAVYEDGRYDEAIAALSALLPASELPLSDQITIQKFLAFSHCVMNRIRQCRTHFDAVLSLDRAFQLSAAERGHPIWGREFVNARNAARSKRPPVPR